MMIDRTGATDADTSRSAAVPEEEGHVLVGFNTLGVYKARADPGLYAKIARRADELGFDSMWAGHHIIFPARIDASYPYAANGVGPHEARMHRIDPLTLFAHLAAVTTRLRFGTGIYLLPLVNPFVTARSVTTADVLSNGRIIFGIGVGWNEREYEIVGANFKNRGARADEIIDILKLLWTEDSIEYHGVHYRFGPVHFEPKPAPKPHPKIIYGGSSPAALNRAARLDGCYLPSGDVSEVKALVADLHRRREQHGLAHEPFEVTALTPTPLDRAALGRLEETGVARALFDIETNPLDGSHVELTEAGLLGNLDRVADAIFG
jgi:probable F420-dependent oxidoreductase